MVSESKPYVAHQRKRAPALGGYLRLPAPPPQVAEALHRDDLTGQLHIFRTVAAATRSAAPALPTPNA